MGRICGGKSGAGSQREVAEDPVQQNLMEMVLAEGTPYVSGRCKKLSTTFIAPPITENPAGL